MINLEKRESGSKSREEAEEVSKIWMTFLSSSLEAVAEAVEVSTEVATDSNSPNTKTSL